MYKKLASIIAAVMLTLSASSAFAALTFTDNELFRVVFDTVGIRQIYDLGSVGTLLTGGTRTIIPGDISVQGAGNLSVCYFALDKSSAALWVSSSTTKAPVATTGGFNKLANGSDDAVHQLLARAVIGETGASLASLANGTATSVTQTLYYISNANNGGTSGIGKATIITSTDTTEITPTSTPTPIPPAFLLMSSGLLGLFGLRRRYVIS